MLVDVTKLQSEGTAKILEEIEISRALFELYEGAIVCQRRILKGTSADLSLQFTHQGLTFLVRPFNLASHWPLADL